MEDGLVQTPQMVIAAVNAGLNPCCDGRWPRTRHSSGCNGCSSVLILVVMEDGLVLKRNVRAS